MADFYFSISAHRKLVRELEKWHPNETSFYPLANLVMKKGVNKSPLDTVVIKDVERVVFVDVVSPQDKFKKNTRVSTRFNNGKRGEEMNRLFLKKCVSPVIDRYPLLDLFTLGHSHPFSNEAWLSSGSRESDEGTLIETLKVYQSQGLGFVLEILAYGRLFKSWEKLISWFPIKVFFSGEWKLAVFAMTPGGLLKFDNQPKILSDEHPYVFQAKLSPYYREPEGEKWADENCKLLINSGFSVSRGYLSRGWEAYTINVSKDFRIVVCMHPSFPRTSAKVYRVVEIGESVNFLELDLPEGLWRTEQSDMSLLKLIEIANFYKKELLQ